MYKIPIFVLQELRTETLLQYVLQMHAELGDKEFSWVCKAPWKWDTFGDDSYGWIILFLLAVTLQEYPYNGVFSSEEELTTHLASHPWTEDTFDSLVCGLEYAMHRCEIHDLHGTVVHHYNQRYSDGDDNVMWNENSVKWSIRISKSQRTKHLLLQIVTASKAWEKAMKEVWLENEKEWMKHLNVRVTTNDTLADLIVHRMKDQSLQIV